MKRLAVECLLAGLRDLSGEPLAGGQVYSYYPDSSSPKPLYDYTNTAQPNPLTLDSFGRAKVFGDGGYDFVIKDADGVTIDVFRHLYYGTPEPTFCTNNSSTENTFVLVTEPTIRVLERGMMFSFLAPGPNTGPVTVNIDNLGAYPLVKSDRAALSSGDIADYQLIQVVFTDSLFYWVAK